MKKVLSVFLALLLACACGCAKMRARPLKTGIVPSVRETRELRKEKPPCEEKGGANGGLKARRTAAENETTSLHNAESGGTGSAREEGNRIAGTAVHWENPRTEISDPGLSPEVEMGSEISAGTSDEGEEPADSPGTEGNREIRPEETQSAPEPVDDSGLQETRMEEAPTEEVPRQDEAEPEQSEEEPGEIPEETEPRFCVQDWVAYAESAAFAMGFELSPEASFCWDNPIRANRRCTCLERDIDAALELYQADGFTRLWIWSEDLGDGEYLIYLGYA